MDKNRLRIILCDDDEDDRSFFQLVIQQWAPGAILKLAESADELLYKLKVSQKIDLVFLDLNMPVISGKECLKLIRANNEFAEVPVIIYSTAADKADVEATFRAGANLYVQKPTSVMGLKKNLDKIAALNKAELLARRQQKFMLEI